MKYSKLTQTVDEVLLAAAEHIKEKAKEETCDLSPEVTAFAQLATFVREKLITSD